MLRFPERQAWHKTPYQIITLFQYHKEYNPHIFKQDNAQSVASDGRQMDDIDIALRGL
jgi:hypothetical protein